MLELLQSPFFALLTFLIGLLVGHRTAFLRDRRKEFNEAAVPVRNWLVSQRSRPNPYTGIGEAQLDRFVQRLPLLRRKRFLAAWERQRQTRAIQQTRDPTGQIYFSVEAATAVAAEAANCLPFTDPI